MYFMSIQRVLELKGIVSMESSLSVRICYNGNYELDKRADGILIIIYVCKYVGYTAPRL